MHTMKTLFMAAIATGLAAPAAADGHLAVKITPDVESVDVMHNGETVTIMRNQDEKNTVNPAFAKTSRKCPPFCIQPSSMGPGVETIGEAELIEYARRMSDGDDSIVLIDSRTPGLGGEGDDPRRDERAVDDAQSGQGADPISIAGSWKTLFGVKSNEELMDFSNCKTVVLFCNGMWCGQSPNNIRTAQVRLPCAQDQVVSRGDAGLGDPGTHHRQGRLTPLPAGGRRAGPPFTPAARRPSRALWYGTGVS